VLIGLVAVTSDGSWNIPPVPNALGKTWAARIVLISALTFIVAACSGLAVAARGPLQYIAGLLALYMASRVYHCLIVALEKSFRRRPPTRS
jgi:predicted membrane channel-forming protein YqfA (hemolysin III family)